jgi:hypothetical protein
MNQRWEAYYQFFPADAQVLDMAPTELGPKPPDTELTLLLETYAVTD